MSTSSISTTTGAALVAGVLGVAAYYASQPGETGPDYTPVFRDGLMNLEPYTNLKQRVTKDAKGTVFVKSYVSDPDAETVDYSKRQGPAYKVDSKARMDITLSKQGLASVAPTTVMERFRLAAKRHADHPALVSATGKTYTWSEYYNESLTVAKGLIQVGLNVGDSVSIIGFNSPEWVMMNMAAIAAGGKAAGIYTSNGPEACQYIAAHSKSKVVCVQDEQHLLKFIEVRDNLPELHTIVMWEGEVPEKIKNDGHRVKVHTWEDFVKIGEKGDDAALQQRIDNQDPGDCCTLIYTSGTTGNPKAVMISNDNCTWTASSLFCNLGDAWGNPDNKEGEHIVSFLPLSHIAAQILDVHMPINTAAMVGGNVTVWFADKMALKGTLLQTLQKARPTFFFGVPRVYEKFAESMKAKGKLTTGLKRKLVDWAKATQTEYYNNMANGGSQEKPFLYGLAAKLLHKVHVQLGFDRCSLFYSAAAPISKETVRFFGAINISICDVFGMSECTGPHTVSRVNDATSQTYAVGSVGALINGVEMKLEHEAGRDADGEGEICFRGRHVMMGYMDEETKTKETIDPEGWLHSGDVGRVDDDGMLYITGRIKELIISAGGENIPPVPIEGVVKIQLPALSNFVMIGDKRKYNTSLVTLKTEPNADGTFSNKLCNEALLVNPKVTTVEEAQKDPVWQAYIQKGIDFYNNNAISNATKIQKFTILSQDFSVPGGELGPTLKLKRQVVSSKYVDEIEAMY